jgi:hypothetical protein
MQKNRFSLGSFRLGTPQARLTLLDFLLSELMAAQMAATRRPKDAAMNIRIQVLRNNPKATDVDLAHGTNNCKDNRP